MNREIKVKTSSSGIGFFLAVVYLVFFFAPTDIGESLGKIHNAYDATRAEVNSNE